MKPEISRKTMRPQNLGTRKWNEIWCGSLEDPIHINEEFVQHCKQLSMSIIDELPLLKKDREFAPTRFQNPSYTYSYDGIVLQMHYFGGDEQSISSEYLGEGVKEKMPLLFDQESYSEAKREFYNYNLILTMVGNNRAIRVPLSCLIEYKGVLMFCRAAIPDSFDKVLPHQFEPQIQEMEEMLRLRFIFNSIGLYRHPQGKYCLLWDLDELIPRMPVEIKPPAYFRRELLEQNEIMLDDQRSLYELYDTRALDEAIPGFLSRMETLDSWVINSEDLLGELHKAGLSMGNLPELFTRSANFPYFKKVLASEMVNEVFSCIMRSELNYMYHTFPAEEFEELEPDMLNRIVMDCAHVMINELFSYSARSESIWKVIVREIHRKYGAVVSKEDVLPGYLLGGIMTRNAIECFFKTECLDREREFFVRENSIPRELLLRFLPKVRRYDLHSVSAISNRVADILSQQATPENFEDLVQILDLRKGEIPSFCEPITDDIRMYMCNFIPLGEHQEFEQVGIYDLLETEPHSYCSTKVSLLAIKWAVKKKNEELANKIFEMKFEENSFWVAEFNPAISEFYDFFSLYNASMGNYDEAIKLAKSSLINCIKLLGPNSLPSADKHYQLGNIFFKVNKKEDALKEYFKTKTTLEEHKQTTIHEYGVILLKLALLYLNFGKISDCVGCGLEALKIFDVNGGSEQEEIEIYEILARAYEITRKNGDLSSVAALCMQKFNTTEDPKIFERMAKIALLPKLTTLTPQDAKHLLRIFATLEELDSSLTSSEAFSYLHHRSQRSLVLKDIFAYIDNIYELAEEVRRKDLFRKHKPLNHDCNSEAGDMLVLFEAMTAMVGFGFVIGCLRDNYYA